jgi:RND superfamily putative drug exporter
MLTCIADRISSHPRRTLLAVLLFVAVAGVIGGPLAGSLKSSGGFVPGGSQSAVATRRLQTATGLEPDAGIVLLVATPRGARADRERIAAIGARLARVTGVARVTAPAAVARDGRQVLVSAVLRAGAEDSTSAKAAQAAFGGTRGVTVGGDAVAGVEISSTVTKDLGFAELLALPLLVGLSLLFFRGRAALMPLAVGGATVLGTFLVLTGVNQLYGLSVFALNLVIGLGLGLSIDYTLFIVTRYRQELAAGADPRAAIVTTVTRTGQTILFSASTVACALTTLVLFPQGFLKSMGIAGATVALVAAAAALIISPALLAVWGPRLARRDTGDPAAGRWYRLARAVMRRPGRVAAVTAAAMLAAAAPALSVVWSPIDSRVVPIGQSARTVADAIGADFAGADTTPVTVAIRAPRTDGGAVAAFAARVAALPGVTAIDRPRALRDATWQLDATVPGAAADARAVADDRLGRAADQGDRDERAHRRRRAVAARAHLPARPAQLGARLYAQRRGGADRLPGHRDARVRAVDRLRGVPARAHQGSARDGRRRPRPRA